MFSSISKVFNFLYSEWQSFKYNFKWEDYVFILDSKLARCAIFVPIIGYIVIFGDYVSEYYFSFNRLTGEEKDFFFLTNQTKFRCIYFGLLCLGGANILYFCRRPHIFKIADNKFDYVERALKLFVPYDYRNIKERIDLEGHCTLYGKYYTNDWESFWDLAVGKDEYEIGNKTGDWASAKQKYENLLRGLLYDHYFRYSRKKRASLTTALIIALIGYLMLVIPSLDLFIRVIISTFF